MSADRLYELLPVVHRARDAELGYPLRAFLRVVAEQVDRVDADIAGLYENWFIETCEDWVVPYIGALIGYRPVGTAVTLPEEDPSRAALRSRSLAPRREVANTIAFRRRKGTLALLELLAQAAAAWPARAVEFYTLLGWMQHVNHVHAMRGRLADLCDGERLDLINGPFDALAHSVDVRRVSSRRTLGRYNIPSVGVFAWRLKSYSITHAPACCIEDEGPQCFTFSALCHDTPLFARPEPETEPTHIADEINLPVPIRRRALEERIQLRPLKTQTSALYYGPGKSLTIWAPDWPTKGAAQPVPREIVVPADLSNWQYRTPRGRVAVDPVTGRLLFPALHPPRRGVWVTYHYGFSADLGGGEYARVTSEPLLFMLYKVARDRPTADSVDSIAAAIARWRQDQQALGPKPADGDPAKAAWIASRERLRAAVVEIQDSAVYSEPLSVVLEHGEYLQIRAANRTRPVIRLLDYMTALSDAFTVMGKAGSRFVLDGLVVTGRSMQVRGPDRGDAEAMAAGDLCDVTIRHCTLVPGWGLECDCSPKRPNEPSLEVFGSAAEILIEHSIVGSIYVVADEVQTDPVSISIRDTIVDATRADLVAIGAAGAPFGFARVSIARTTVFGEVRVHGITLGENAIFMGAIAVARRQWGCIRFSYVTPGSRTPRRHHCQPDLVVAAVKTAQPPVPEAEQPALAERETGRVRPRFTSVRYGNPGYAQLAFDCAAEIVRGADDESEMGAFHDLYQPQREANLRARLDEFTPAGMDAGLILAT